MEINLTLKMSQEESREIIERAEALGYDDELAFLKDLILYGDINKPSKFKRIDEKV